MKGTKCFVVEGRFLVAGFDWEVFKAFSTRVQAEKYKDRRMAKCFNILGIRPEFRITVSHGTDKESDK